MFSNTYYNITPLQPAETETQHLIQLWLSNSSNYKLGINKRQIWLYCWRVKNGLENPDQKEMLDISFNSKMCECFYLDIPRVVKR